MQWQDTPNTDSFSGFPPVCDEEVPVFFLPLSGIDRHQGGGSLGVDGWVWPPALHAIRTTNFFLAINTAILQNYTGEWVRVRVKNMINHDCWIYVSATVCVVKADGGMGPRSHWLCWPEGGEESVCCQLWLFWALGLQKGLMTGNFPATCAYLSKGFSFVNKCHHCF